MTHAIENAAARSTRRDIRRQAMMEAAAELFLDKGYAATSLADVVRRSGGSLQTLYELFGSKDGLFKALIESRCAQVTDVFDEEGIADRLPEQALMEFGRRLFELVMSPEGLAAMRLIVAEGGQAPEIAETFFANGPDMGKAKVGRYLAHQVARGRLAIDDIETAAIQFCDMVKSHYCMKALCGIPIALSPEQAEAHVRGVVAMFLRAYAARK
ncbi:TetR/AcrR family transcriptional regulator [Desertibaculum subflavum]|uniref:TetR/AcrR family transcriptional regulator n=1 Tax=Desertibaculum subflavum TaxID=2268458 RepID=UPI000E66B656